MAAVDPNIALLDRLDEDYRRKDMEDFVDNMSYDGSETMEILQGFLDEAEQQKPNPTSETVPHGNYAVTAPLSTTLALLGSEDGETVRRLVNELNQKQVEAQSLQLQLNHAKMQVEALIFSEQKHREDCERANLHNATLQQDKLLLEVQLKKVAGFEGKNGRRIIEELRGKMLHAANKQLESLQHTHLTLQAESNERFHLLNQTIETLTQDNHALQSRLSTVSDEIARNAILSAAQERRLIGTLNLQKYEFENHDKEFISLHAKYELLSQQHTQLIQEQFQLHVQVKTLETDKSQLESQIEEKNEVLQTYQEQLFDVQTHNSSLENMLSNLRGSNLETMEMNLLQQMENQRLLSRQKEETIKENLKQAMAQISMTAHQRDNLRHELENREVEVRQLKELLHQVQNNLSGPTPGSAPDAQVVTVNDEFLVGHTGTSSAKIQENKQPQPQQPQPMTLQSLQNMSFNCSMSSDDEQSSSVDNEDWIAQLTHTPHTHTHATNDSHTGYISVKVLEWLNVVLSSLLKKKSNESDHQQGYSESQLRNSLMSFLQSKGIPTSHDTEEVYQQLIETLSTSRPHQEENAEEEESIDSIRIQQLEKEVKGWRKFVNKILRKVAQLPTTTNTPSSSDENFKLENESLQTQILTLQDHLSYMKQEMNQLEEIASVQKDLGRHEAAEHYEVQVTRLQSQIIQLEAHMQAKEAQIKELSTQIDRFKVVKVELEQRLEHAELSTRAVALEKDSLLLKLSDVEHEMNFKIEDLSSALIQSQEQLEAVKVKQVLERESQLKEIEALQAAIKAEQEASQVIAADKSLQLEALQATYDSFKEELMIKSEELQAAKTVVHQQQEDAVQQQVKIDEQAMEIESLQVMLNMTKKELTVNSQELQAAELIVTNQQKEVDRLSTVLAATAAAEASSSHDQQVKIDALQVQLDELQAVKEAYQVMIDEQSSQLIALQSTLDSTKEELHAANSITHQQHAKIDQRAIEMESLQVMLNMTKEELSMKDQELQVMKSSAVTVSSHDQQIKIDARQAQLDNLQAAKEASQVIIDHQTAQIESLQRTLYTTKEEMQVTVNNQEAEIEQLLAVTSAAKTGEEDTATRIMTQQGKIAEQGIEIGSIQVMLNMTRDELLVKSQELQAMKLSAALAATAAEAVTVSSHENLQVKIDEQVMLIQSLQALIDDLQTVKEASQVMIVHQTAEIESLQKTLHTTKEDMQVIVTTQQAEIDHLKTKIENLSLALSLSQQQLTNLHTATRQQEQASQQIIESQTSEITRLSQQVIEQEKSRSKLEEEDEDILVKEAILALESFALQDQNHSQTNENMTNYDSQEAHEEAELSLDQTTIHSLQTHNSILQSSLQQTEEKLVSYELQVRDLSVELTEAMDMEDLLRHEITVLEQANQQLQSRLDDAQSQQKRDEQESQQDNKKEEELIVLKNQLLEIEATHQQREQQLETESMEKTKEITCLQSELAESKLQLTQAELRGSDNQQQYEVTMGNLQKQLVAAITHLNEAHEQHQGQLQQITSERRHTIIEYQRRETELLETISLLEQRHFAQQQQQQQLMLTAPKSTTEQSTLTDDNDNEEELFLAQQLQQLQSQQQSLYQHVQQQSEDNLLLQQQLTVRNHELLNQKAEFENRERELKSALRKQFKHELALREKHAEDIQNRLLEELNLIREKMMTLLTTTQDEAHDVNPPVAVEEDVKVTKQEMEVQTEDNSTEDEMLKEKLAEHKVQNEELQAIIRRLEHDRNRLYQETLTLQHLAASHTTVNVASIAIQTDDNNSSVIAVETAKELLKRQKLKLQKKHQHKVNLLEEAHILEKEHIIRLVRAECQEIVHETNHLLMAKKELVLQQQLVSETIAEISNRSMSLFSFSTPQRGTTPGHGLGVGESQDGSLILNNSTSTSGGGGGHYTTANTTPNATAAGTHYNHANANMSTSNTNTSNNTTRAAFRYSNNSYHTNSSQSTIPVMSQAQPVPAGSISPITRRSSSFHQAQHNKQSTSSNGGSNLRSSFPFPIPSKTASSLPGSINVKDGGSVGVGGSKAVATGAATSGELYPEMLSPETTKQFVENLYKRSVE